MFLQPVFLGHTLPSLPWMAEKHLWEKSCVGEKAADGLTFSISNHVFLGPPKLYPTATATL